MQIFWKLFKNQPSIAPVLIACIQSHALLYVKWLEKVLSLLDGKELIRPEQEIMVYLYFAGIGCG